MPYKQHRKIIINEDLRPDDITYAILSEHVYKSNISKGDLVRVREEYWEVIRTEKA